MTVLKNLRPLAVLAVLALSLAPATAAPQIKLVVLDMGGTIIQDHGEVPTALKNALSKRNIPASDAEIANWRGSSKRGMVRHFVEMSNTPKNRQAALIEEIYADFSAQTDKAYANVQPIVGAEEAFKREALGKLKTMGTACFDCLRHNRRCGGGIPRCSPRLAAFGARNGRRTTLPLTTDHFCSIPTSPA